MATLDAINAMNETELGAQLMACCGSRAWANHMIARRPFRSEADLRGTADSVWRELKAADWLEAFAEHPRIGESAASVGNWSAKEQSAAARAADDVKRELARAQRDYENRFGHIYIICATGRSAGEILTNLRQRMSNDARAELDISAEEQRKIMQLRLQNWLYEDSEEHQ